MPRAAVVVDMQEEGLKSVQTGKVSGAFMAWADGFALMLGRLRCDFVYLVGLADDGPIMPKIESAARSRGVPVRSFTKSVASAWFAQSAGVSLQQHIMTDGIDEIVLTGVNAGACIRATADDLLSNTTIRVIAPLEMIGDVNKPEDGCGALFSLAHRANFSILPWGLPA